MAGLDDAPRLSEIMQTLLNAGYTERDIARIWSGNVMRGMREVRILAANARGNARNTHNAALARTVPANTP